jgi:4-methoxybenzoate monooxygenase (O-demethylating)
VEAKPVTGAPVLDIDPFDEEVLRFPDPVHQRLRDAAPVVYLERYGIWSMARFAEVQAALRDHQTFCSGAGAGLSDFTKEEPWRPPSLLLEADPPEHTRVRRVVARALTPRFIEHLRDELALQATGLVAGVAARGTFDAVPDLARAYPLRVFPDAVGLSPGGRENLLTYGTMVFNAFGPRNRLLAESMAAAEPVRAWIAGHCQRAALAPGGLGTEIYAAADRDEITEDEAGLLVRSLLSAGVDTTVHTLAWAVHALATCPDEWQALRDDPSLARAAVEETLRHASPVQTFFRTTTRAADVAGTIIPAGQKVLLFLGAANRDPRAWPDPDRFDIRRRTAGHVGLGSGIHACVGAALARLEGELLLTAMARQLTSLELAGPVRPYLNNTIKGLAGLPVRVRAA